MTRGRLAWGLLVLALVTVGCARPRAVIPVAPGPGWEETGQASWYGVPYHGRRTASGEVYDMHQMTAAHRTLPFGTWVAVEHTGTGRSTEVRINDRGPFVDGRILDLSYAAARVLDAIGPGLIPVRLRIIDPPPPATIGGSVRSRVRVGRFEGRDSAVAAARDLAARGRPAVVVSD